MHASIIRSAFPAYGNRLSSIGSSCNEESATCCGPVLRNPVLNVRTYQAKTAVPSILLEFFLLSFLKVVFLRSCAVVFVLVRFGLGPVLALGSAFDLESAFGLGPASVFCLLASALAPAWLATASRSSTSSLSVQSISRCLEAERRVRGLDGRLTWPSSSSKSKTELNSEACCFLGFVLRVDLRVVFSVLSVSEAAGSRSGRLAVKVLVAVVLWMDSNCHVTYKAQPKKSVRRWDREEYRTCPTIQNGAE